MKIRALLLTSLLIAMFCADAQVITLKNLFQKKTMLQKDFHDLASSYTALQLDPAQLAASRNLTGNFSLNVPFENSELVADLHPATITSPHFSVIEAMAGGATRTVNYQLPSFYQGTVHGESRSTAAISISDKELTGILSDSKSNIVLGAIEQNGVASNQYALYRDIDLKVRSQATCFADDLAPIGTAGTASTNKSSSRELAATQPVEIYFECDYKFYQDKGSSVSNVVNYVLGFFNSVALLYQRENIPVQVSQIKVWTTADPYAALTSTSTVLSAFAANMSTDPYVGDYAHFLSTRALGGGIAYLLSNPCSSQRGNRTGVSAIDKTYKNFPTYSWTVNVVTHELGHNFGSHHTHWCGWPGGPIDWCAPTANASYIEGACTTGPLPAAGGGTIMSYCHLLGAVGINLSNGFGTLPGNAIRTAISSGPCFATCKMTASTTKVDASCGQDNGSATITPVNGTATYSYLWSNGQTSATLTNATPGIYTVTVTDAAGCKVMGIDTIVNAGASLPVTLTPSGTASFCGGTSLLLSATNNPAYTYQWYNGASPISGAVQPTLASTTAGTYGVQVTSGTCTVTKTVTVTQVSQPTAAIAATGATSFCTGNSVLLNATPASGYQYQWYKDGTAITSAISNSYTAGAAGNYTVKVYSGTCQSTSTGIAVAVVSSPTATVTANGPLSFCAGGSVTLTANSGTGYQYQWYRNNSLITGATLISYTATTAGSYTVTNSLGTCSKTSAAISVTLLPNPVVTVTPDSVVIRKFQTVTLTGFGAATYNWTTLPGYIGSKGDSALLAPLSSTTYHIEGIGANGCKATATARVFVTGCGDVSGLTATAYSPSRIYLNWTNPQESSGDSVQYRLKGTLTWTSVYTVASQLEINGLIPAAEYEYRIVALCSTTNLFVPSPQQSFTMPGLSSGLYLKLFPNPVIQTAKLEIIVAKESVLQVDLYNMSGQKVMNITPAQTVPAGQIITEISAGKLAAGLYHVVVRIDGKRYTLKMVVQR